MDWIPKKKSNETKNRFCIEKCTFAVEAKETKGIPSDT